jgi:hypothetical protein
MSSNDNKLKNINMIIPDNLNLNELTNTKLLIDTIEDSIINVFEREINKNALSEQDKIELNKVFSNIKKKTLEN